MLPKLTWPAMVLLLFACSASNDGANELAPQPPGFPSELVAEDCLVLEAVLIDLLDDTKFTPRGPFAENKTRIVVTIIESNKKAAKYWLSQEALDAYVNDEEEQSVPDEVGADLRRRNVGPVSLVSFEPKDPRIVVGDLMGLPKDSPWEWEDAFDRRFPDTKCSIQPFLPGYSTDGETAVVRFHVSHTPHGAHGTALLVKEMGKWKVKWRYIAYFA